jgi:hypothetical protein
VGEETGGPRVERLASEGECRREQKRWRDLGGIVAGNGRGFLEKRQGGSVGGWIFVVV